MDVATMQMYVYFGAAVSGAGFGFGLGAWRQGKQRQALILGLLGVAASLYWVGLKVYIGTPWLPWNG